MKKNSSLKIENDQTLINFSSALNQHRYNLYFKEQRKGNDLYKYFPVKLFRSIPIKKELDENIDIHEKEEGKKKILDIFNETPLAILMELYSFLPLLKQNYHNFKERCSTDENTLKPLRYWHLIGEENEIPRNHLDSFISTMKDNVIIKKSNIIKAGRGLFAKKKFLPGDLILPYEGAILNSKEFHELYKKQICAKMVLNVDRNIYIDSSNPKDENEPLFMGAFANDTYNTTYKHNAVFQSSKNMTPFLQAIQTIEPDEEIFVDYGPVYWKNQKENDLESSSESEIDSFSVRNFFEKEISHEKDDDIDNQEEEEEMIEDSDEDDNDEIEFSSRTTSSSSISNFPLVVEEEKGEIEREDEIIEMEYKDVKFKISKKLKEQILDIFDDIIEEISTLIGIREQSNSPSENPFISTWLFQWRKFCINVIFSNTGFQEEILDLDKISNGKKTQKYYKNIVDLVSRYFPVNPFSLKLSEVTSRKARKMLLENLYLLLSNKIENDNLMRCLNDLKRKTTQEKKWLKELDENIDDISKIVMCHLFFTFKMIPRSENWRNTIKEIEKTLNGDDLVIHDYSSCQYVKKQEDGKMKRKKLKHVVIV